MLLGSQEMSTLLRNVRTEFLQPSLCHIRFFSIHGFPLYPATSCIAWEVERSAWPGPSHRPAYLQHDTLLFHIRPQAKWISGSRSIATRENFDRRVSRQAGDHWRIPAVLCFFFLWHCAGCSLRKWSGASSLWVLILGFCSAAALSNEGLPAYLIHYDGCWISGVSLTWKCDLTLSTYDEIRLACILTCTCL